jgi:Tfp pilus assembly protein PilV
MHMRGDKRGMSIVEIILASGLFVIVATSIVTLILQSYVSNRESSEQTVATQFASEGLEAARSIRNQAYGFLATTTGAGVAIVNSVWAISGTSSTFDKYTRVMVVSSTQRDANGNIVASGGTIDPDTRKVISTVTWPRSPSLTDSVSLTDYFTNWRAPYGGGGMLVYGDGGTTADTITYRTFSAVTGLWSAPSSTADVTSASTNQYLRAVRLFASPTRNEKILISRHYNGTTQFIYAQVYNGTTKTWGNVINLASSSVSTFLDVQNFSGAYLANGTFMAVYSDWSIIPKARIWDGTAWGAPISLTTLGTGNIPNFVVAKARPGTNEIMAAFFTQVSSTISEYLASSTWSAVTIHATAAPTSTKRFVDFDWVQGASTSTGAIVYATASSTKSLTVKIFQSDGTGAGSWGSAVATAAQTNVVGPVGIAGGPSQFQMCDKSNNTTSSISCYKVTFAGTVATITNPTNPTLTASTDAGIQRSYHFDFESSGNNAIAVFSNSSTIPQLQVYTSSTASWTASPTAIATSPFSPGVFKSVRVVPYQNSDDIMILMADANLNLYSAMWDGINNAIATTTAGRVFSQDGLNGSNATDLWYDFAWNLP